MSRRAPGVRQRHWSVSVARPMALWLLAGLVLGAAWHGLTPVARDWSEGYERDFSGDVTLAVLEVVAGAIVALVGLSRPGPGAALRFLAAVSGAALASAVALGTGLLLGAQAPSLPAVLLLWPLAVALVTLLGTLLITIVLREPYAD